MRPPRPTSNSLRSLLAFAFFFALLATTGGARQPNIILVLADDLGWADILSGRGPATPNLDRLAAEGMRLGNYHSAPNCQPARAALLSGQYSPRTGVYTVGEASRFDTSSRPLRPAPNSLRLPAGLPTLADALRGAGYATGMFGKWHLGDEPADHPSRHGFDEAIVTSLEGHLGFRTNPRVEYPKNTYLADFVTERATDFVRRHSGAPFFLYLPHLAVHAPFQGRADIVARFRKEPALCGGLDPVYAAMIASLDESVGRLADTLRELGLERDTVFIFTSDNGGVGGYAREGLVGTPAITDNAPLRHGKGSLYEGGVRVPFLVRWPGRVPAGSTSDAPAIHVDLYPTLLEIAGAKTPAGHILDGASLLSDWLASPERPARPPLYQHFPGYLGVQGHPHLWRATPASTIQETNWKLHLFHEDGRVELYDLGKDIGETKNLAETRPDIARDLRNKLDAWFAALRAPMPTPRRP